MLAINATVNRANTTDRMEKLKEQDVCMDIGYETPDMKFSLRSAVLI